MITPMTPESEDPLPELPELDWHDSELVDLHDWLTTTLTIVRTIALATIALTLLTRL